MGLGIDPKVDIAFKKLFGSVDNVLLLIALLHAVLELARRITGLEIAQAHTEKNTPLDKQAIGDVRARDQGNRQFHVEMQGQVPWFFPKRVLFYWGKFHAEQLREGENYQTLRPTFSVCFTNSVLFPQIDEHHLVFRLREVKRELLWTDDLEIHLIELPKFTKTAEQLSSDLDRWCYFLRHGADLDLEHLPASLDVPEIRRAMEVLTVFTQDERERLAYELRVKAQRDHSSLLQEIQDAEVRGEERGIEKGVLLGQIRVYQELLKQAQTPEAELTALSREALLALHAQLREQLLRNGA
jgi:predicted transposase/invertase (TIGR01784 family)